MTTVFENPANGYRVKVDGLASFLWMSIIGPFYFLARGNTRHFFFGFFLYFLVLPYLIYPFFAASILRTMYNERGYRVVEERPTSIKGPLILGILVVTFIVIFAFVRLGGDVKSVDALSSQHSGNQHRTVEQQAPLGVPSGLDIARAEPAKFPTSAPTASPSAPASIELLLTQRLLFLN